MKFEELKNFDNVFESKIIWRISRAFKHNLQLKKKSPFMSFHVIFSPGLKFLGRKILAVEVSCQISDEFNCLTCRVDIILVVLPWHLYNNLLIICHINSRLKLSINHIVIEKSLHWWVYTTTTQKQPSRGVLRKSCYENMQQISRRTPMSKCDFNKVGIH